MSSRFDALKEEIDAKRRFIATLPGWTAVTRAQAHEKANHIKQLAEKEEEYKLLVEAKRIESVVCKHEEMHPPAITYECPICLDEINMTSPESLCFFLCCGNGMCRECWERSGGRMKKCPLCRANLPTTDEEGMALTKKTAENGRHPWAMRDIGNSFYNGTDGYPLDKSVAFDWYKLAAEQNDPGAMANLAAHYHEGDVIEQSYPKAVELMAKAADKWWTEAQIELAIWFFRGVTGLPQDSSKAVYYLTLACSQQEDSHVEGNLTYLLDSLHGKGGGGLPKSFILAKHYFGRAAKNGFEEAIISQAMFRLWQSQYDSFQIPGHSVLPKCLYWLRKAAASGDSDAVGMFEMMEKLGQSRCADCCKSAWPSERFKQCARCKGAWYCSRDCQVQAWKAGHKIDCINY